MRVVSSTDSCWGSAEFITLMGMYIWREDGRLLRTSWVRCCAARRANRRPMSHSALPRTSSRP
eukprot:1015895-Prymnesium_polylepis.2